MRKNVDWIPLDLAAAEHGYTASHFRWLVGKGRLSCEVISGVQHVSRKSVSRFIALRQEIYGKVRIGPGAKTRCPKCGLSFGCRELPIHKSQCGRQRAA